MRSPLVLAALTAALLLAPAAAQAAPFTIGAGENPGLAVDSAGTAYIAYNGTEPTGVRSLHFCRLARGATTCAGAPTIGAPVYSLYRPLISVSGATVHVVQTRYGFSGAPFTQVVEFTSNDGGNSFDGGTTIGDITFEEGIAGPGDTFSAVSNAVTGGAFFQNMPDTADSGANLSADHLYNGAVAITPEGRLITVFTDASDNAQFRLHSGAGSPNDAATWGAPVELGVEAYPKLAAGPSGLFLLGSDAQRTLNVRRWNGTTFGGPIGIGAGNEAAQAHISQDPGGVVHVVWPTFESSGIVLHHAVGDGKGFFQSVIATQGDGEETQARVAAAADHVGVAIWSTAQQIRVTQVGADQPVFHKTVVVKPISGTVRVKVPGATSFVDLAAAGSVPLGASVDVKHGRLALSAKPSASGKARSVQLYSGQFKVTQTGRFTQFALNEALASCKGKAAAAAKKPKTRKLWGSGSGAFRTSGRYSAATVRGTKWLVQDSCAGTLTRVTQGSVAVRDNVRHKTIVVRAGKRYLARPRR